MLGGVLRGVMILVLGVLTLGFGVSGVMGVSGGWSILSGDSGSGLFGIFLMAFGIVGIAIAIVFGWMSMKVIKGYGRLPSASGADGE